MVSLRLGQGTALTVRRTVIHYRALRFATRPHAGTCKKRTFFCRCKQCFGLLHCVGRYFLVLPRKYPKKARRGGADRCAYRNIFAFSAAYLGTEPPPCTPPGRCAWSLQMRVGFLLNCTINRNFPWFIWAYTRETLNKSTSAFSGSFDPTFHQGKLEIHKVFLRFP